MYKMEMDLQTQKTNLQLPKGKDDGGINREFGIDTYILLYLKQIANNSLFIAQKICSGFCNNLNGENF